MGVRLLPYVVVEIPIAFPRVCLDFFFFPPNNTNSSSTNSKMACEEVVDMIVKVLTGASHLVTLVEKEWGYFRDWKRKRKEADGMNSN